MRLERALVAVIGCKASCKLLLGSCINMLMLPMYDAFCGRMKWRSVLASGPLALWASVLLMLLEVFRGSDVHSCTRAVRSGMMAWGSHTKA